MKKLLTLSALIAGGIYFSPSAMACSPNLPNYGNCIRQQQQQQQQIMQAQQQGYFNYGGSPSRSTPTRTIYISPPTHDIKCRPAQDVHQVCEYRRLDTGVLDMVAGKNKKGDDVYFIGYDARGNVEFKTIYEYQPTKHGALVKQTTYDGNGKLDHISQEVNKLLEKNKHNLETTFYDANGNISRIEHRRIGEIVYSQEYRNNKKHGKERHYTGSADEHVLYEMDWANGVKHGKEYRYDEFDDVVIYEANWANGVKHGEEKIYKKYRFYHGTPKLKKTVMWENGKKVR